MVIIASESVDTFDRNGWSTSIGMGGQDGPEYAGMNRKGRCVLVGREQHTPSASRVVHDGVPAHDHAEWSGARPEAHRWDSSLVWEPLLGSFQSQSTHARQWCCRFHLHCVTAWRIKRVWVEVLRIFVQAVFGSLRRRACEHSGILRSQSAVVTFIQRFGDAQLRRIVERILAREASPGRLVV